MDPLNRDLEEDIERYKKIFQVTEKLHSSLDFGTILGELFTILQGTFPGLSCSLHLSEDTHSFTHFPMMKMEYNSENISKIKGLVTGHAPVEKTFTEHAVIYLPLKGNDCVYGVLQVIAANTLVFPKNDADFIALIVASAGSALGNAHLYHQSKQAVAELELINEATQRLALTNSKLRDELEMMVITDHLTKLNSRKFLEEKIQRFMKEDVEGAFILIDIDNFKEINDKYGHQVGDEVLIQVANLIKSNIREHDIGARWGGEELAIYLPRAAIDAGIAIAERLAIRVAERSEPHITVSCGVSYWHKDRHDSYKHLFNRADEALYCAKGTGKNKVVSQSNTIKVS